MKFEIELCNGWMIMNVVMNVNLNYAMDNLNLSYAMVMNVIMQ
jgi:hypothetical protein